MTKREARTKYAPGVILVSLNKEIDVGKRNTLLLSLIHDKGVAVSLVYPERNDGGALYIVKDAPRDPRTLVSWLNRRSIVRHAERAPIRTASGSEER